MEKKIKIGLTCGVYDLFHIGHLNLLERCKEKCDYLIVGICGDDYVREIKNKEPIIPEEDRFRIIQALKCVDKVEMVSIEETVDKVAAWNRFHFDVLFAGDDWKGSERFKETDRAFKENNLDIEVVFFPYTQSVSTTMLREKLSGGI